MADKLLKMAFSDPKRWAAAIKHGVDKGIPIVELRYLADEDTRIEIYKRIKNGTYRIAPPHTALIPKDDGTDRVVSICENIDRVVLSLFNDMLFELTPDMIHPRCFSYQKGLSCGKVVQDISRHLAKGTGLYQGFKSDLSKYFDSVPIRYIDDAFDKVEQRFGKSAVIDVLRDFYHNDLFFDIEDIDENGNPKLKSKYQSLKQGVATASWLADVILYPVHEALWQIAKRNDAAFAWYSDDGIYAGMEWEEALVTLRTMIEEMGMTLNPKKIELISQDKWVKFLGFSIKGKDISLSPGAIKKFQEAIDEACDTDNYDKANGAVIRALYKGYDGFSWAARVLRVINVKHDIDVINGYVMDSLRAVKTGKRNIGGLGFCKSQKDGCISRGTGRNVKANKQKIPHIDGYYTVGCMQNALLIKRSVYESIVVTNM